MQELNRKLNAFGVDPIAIEALKVRQLLCFLCSCSYLYFVQLLSSIETFLNKIFFDLKLYFKFLSSHKE